MTRYYCSGFDKNNAFGHGLGEQFLHELKNTKSLVFIPGGFDKIQKAKEVYVPAFIEHFKKVGIKFDNNILITPDMSISDAKKFIREASFVFLMGGDPFSQKALCQQLDIWKELKKYDGVMLGCSAGAMIMSKYIIITPCSEEYPDFHIEDGLNFDGISVYPHNNIDADDYPDILVSGDKIYKKKDLIKVAKEYENFYLLQDFLREDGLTDISVIQSKNGKLYLYKENNGRVWIATSDGIKKDEMI